MTPEAAKTNLELDLVLDDVIPLAVHTKISKNLKNVLKIGQVDVLTLGVKPLKRSNITAFRKK